MNDRRAVPRLPAHLPLMLRAGDAFEPLLTRDVSATGAYVVSQAPRRAGEILHLQLRSELHGFRVDLRALVVRVADLGAADPGMGVVWLDARSSSTAAIAGFLRESLGLGPGVVAQISGNVYIFDAARQLLGSLHSGGHGPEPSRALGRHAPSGRTEVVGFRSALAGNAQSVEPAAPAMPAFAPRAPTPAQPMRAVPSSRISSAATPIALGAGPVAAPAAEVADSLPRSPRPDPHGREKRTTSPERGAGRADSLADARPSRLPPYRSDEVVAAPPRRPVASPSDEVPRQRALLGARPRVATPRQSVVSRDIPGRDAASHDVVSRDAPSRDAPGRDAPSRDAPGRDAPNHEATRAASGHAAPAPVADAAHGSVRASESGVFRALLSITGKLRGHGDGPVALGKMAVSPDGRFYTAGHGAIPDRTEALEMPHSDEDDA